MLFKEIMKEVSRREKQAGIIPDPNIDTYMKAISVKGLERSLQTDYILKLGIIAIITATVLLRTHLGVDIIHANYYMGSLFYALLLLMVNGFPELAMTVSRLPVFYKQRDYYFYPAWAYAIPSAILKIPISLVESLVWTSITYYVIGYSPEAARFFRHFLLLFCVHQMSLSLFRFIASYFQTAVASTVGGTMCLLVILLFGGFILPKPSLPDWLKWGFWISPLSYIEIGLSVNEFHAPRWQKILSTNMTIGQQVLTSRGLNYNSNFYWIAVGALLVSTLLLNFAFTLSLTLKRPVGVSRAIISREKLSQIQGMENEDIPGQMEKGSITGSPVPLSEPRRTGKMVLPFIPLTISFQNVNYYVETPPLILMKRGGELIYTGPIGKHSSKIIEYFEAKSACYEMDSKELVKRLSTPAPDLKDLSFPTRYPRNSWVQFKACLWKQYLSYWRSPSYNLVRISFTLVSSIIFGLIFWQHGKTIYTFLFQVVIELPYVLIEVVLFMVVAYPAIGYYWTVYKFFWFFYTMFCTLLYFIYLGMLLVSLTPNVQVATILASVCYTLFNLFSGFIVPSPQIPKWWIWLYYLCPMSWSLHGLFSSQYGDVQKEIMVFEETKSIASFLEDYFGFHHNLLGLVAVVLLALPLIYASLFAYFIGKLNFQTR
ncbi:Pleiotropic drug resistance protein [Musa troglodytarum]|uniref:Pleiotropic drug resistance protein n=1 Tax=Musa troglodytarum TaxID=320322 RepID=A0A9E7FD76_9LILI|nr:Pleiotropic drug resistance protein [Musa troglodytarum]